MTFLYFLYAFTPWTLLLLRIALGVVFIKHGMPKLKMAEQIAASMGMSSAKVKLIGLVEFLGGLSVLLGLFTQIGALGLMIVMIGAMYYKKMVWHVPFVAMEKMGWEYDLILFTTALLLVTSGGSLLSLDWLVFGIA